MAAPKDVKGRVMGDKRLLEQLGTLIPGFSGYKEKELRRESDRLLREMLTGELKGVDEALDSVYEEITGSKITGAYDAMNTATALMDRIIGRVEIADAGYAGFFNAIKIREDALDAAYDYDKGLFDEVEKISEKVDQLAAAAEKEEKPEAIKLAKELKGIIMDFDKKLDRRKAVLLKLE